MKSYTNPAARRRQNPKLTRAELEARRLRDLARLAAAWRVLTGEARP